MNYINKQNLRYATVVGIILIIALGLYQRNQNKSTNVPIVKLAQTNTLLSEEEQAQVRVAQELVQKEAENLKIKEKLIAERAELDKKIEAVEVELGKIRTNKLGFQLRLRQSVSQGQSTKQNAVVTVSVIDKDSLGKLGITSSSLQLGELTR